MTICKYIISLSLLRRAILAPAFLLVTFVYAAALHAADLSNTTISGKWVFTHMLLDGETRMDVNRLVEFTQSGEAVWYDAAGIEKSMGNYTINAGVIDYVDTNGSQNWKVVEFREGTLHVDHKGAEMFFQRQ